MTEEQTEGWGLFAVVAVLAAVYLTVLLRIATSVPAPGPISTPAQRPPIVAPAGGIR